MALPLPGEGDVSKEAIDFEAEDNAILGEAKKLLGTARQVDEVAFTDFKMRTGERVVLTGLKNRTDLNGQAGVVFDMQDDMFHVLVDTTQERCSVHGRNLEHTSVFTSMEQKRGWLHCVPFGKVKITRNGLHPSGYGLRKWFFVIRDGFLYQYASQNLEKIFFHPKRVFPIDGTTLRILDESFLHVVPEKGSTFAFTISSSKWNGGPLILSASSEQERREWMDSVNLAGHVSFSAALEGDKFIRRLAESREKAYQNIAAAKESTSKHVEEIARVRKNSQIKKLQVEDAVHSSLAASKHSDAVLNEVKEKEKEQEKVLALLNETEGKYRSVVEHREKTRRMHVERKLSLERIHQQLDDLQDQKRSSQAKLEELEAQIKRLEPVNLAAIDELAVEAERKDYLDRQNADLEEALETLEKAIEKIDRESRTRFKETFDQINSNITGHAASKTKDQTARNADKTRCWRYGCQAGNHTGYDANKRWPAKPEPFDKHPNK